MKYEKLSICPSELQDLLELVNLLPPDIKQLESDLNALYSQFSQGWLKNSESNCVLLKLLDESSRKIRKLIPPELAEWLSKSKAFGFENEKLQLQGLINEKITLLWIIEAFETFKGFNNPSQTFSFSKSIAVFGFNEDSTIQLSSFRVVEVLTKNKIPIERIRVCPICGDVFWAKRIEAKTCSKRRCLNNFHQRKRRINEYEKRLNAEWEKLGKQRKSLPESHALITEQTMRVNKLSGKINAEKMKNGTT